MRVEVTALACLAGVICLANVEGAQCSYSLSPTNASVAAAGGGGSFGVTVGSSCNWTAATASVWLHTTNFGTGSGTVNYTVDANGSPLARSATITVGGQGFTVNQAAAPITLGLALDSPGLTWVTTTNYPWAGASNVAYDGVASATSGNPFIPNSTSGLQTIVVGPGTLSFWWKVDADVTDSLQFYIGASEQAQIAGLVDWNYRTYSIPAGTNILTWQYVKDALFNAGQDRGWVDQVIYTTNPPISLQNALNACGASWTSGGNTNFTYWHGQTNVTHDGIVAAQSGQIYNLQQSTLQTSVSGVTSVGFWWQVSSEYDPSTGTIYDNLGFYIDGVLQANINVENAWQQKSYPLSAGPHTLQWIFSKDDSDFFPIGQNCAWVDQVVFSPSLPMPPFTLTAPTMQLNGQFSLVVSNGLGCPCSVQYVTNLTQTNWTTLANLITTNVNRQVVDSTASNSPSRLYRVVAP